MTDPATPALGAARLLKLASALEAATRAEKYSLNMRSFIGSSYNKTGVDECGTAGCALGFCPMVFPEDWCYDTQEPSHPFLRFREGVDRWSVFTNAERFFGLSGWAACRDLFAAPAYDEPSPANVVARIRKHANRMLRGFT